VPNDAKTISETIATKKLMKLIEALLHLKAFDSVRSFLAKRHETKLSRSWGWRVRPKKIPRAFGCSLAKK